MLRKIVAAACFVLLTVIAAPAEATVTCIEGECSIEEHGEGHTRPVEPGKSDGKPAGPGKKRVCEADGVTLPCSTDLGVWVSHRQMWCTPIHPQPPKTDPIWAGHTDGVIKRCTRPEGIRFPDQAMSHLAWFPSNDAPPPPPDPKQLAWKALATIHLQPITPGTTPTTLEQNPNALGAVGMPLWLWPRNPTPNQTGPTTASATEQGHTVTITAKAQSITWNLGNNTPPITCTTWKQPHKNTHPNTPVTCGAQTGYPKQGTYTITATTNWTIHWQGIGQHGTLHHTTTTQQTLKIGELQALNTNPRNP